MPKPGCRSRTCTAGTKPRTTCGRSKFGGMSVPEAKRLKELEAENTRLKKLLAEQVFENDVIKDACEKSVDRTGSTGAGNLWPFSVPVSRPARCGCALE